MTVDEAVASARTWNRGPYAKQVDGEVAAVANTLANEVERLRKKLEADNSPRISLINFRNSGRGW